MVSRAPESQWRRNIPKVSRGPPTPHLTLHLASANVRQIAPGSIVPKQHLPDRYVQLALGVSRQLLNSTKVPKNSRIDTREKEGTIRGREGKEKGKRIGREREGKGKRKNINYKACIY